MRSAPRLRGATSPRRVPRGGGGGPSSEAPVVAPAATRAVGAPRELRLTLPAAWSALLGRYPWDWFYTLTLRNQFVRAHLETFSKAWRLCLLETTRERLWETSPGLSRRDARRRVVELLPVWALFFERTRGATGEAVRWHGHGLAWFPDLECMPRYQQVRAWWNRERGFMDISHPQSQADVAQYVGKYVTKGVVSLGGTSESEWILSPNFGAPSSRVKPDPRLC